VKLVPTLVAADMCCMCAMSNVHVKRAAHIQICQAADAGLTIDSESKDNHPCQDDSNSLLPLA
jgi:hypothetical protein